MPETNPPNESTHEPQKGPTPESADVVHHEAVHHERVMDHFEDPYHYGPLECLTHAAEAEIPVCRDKIRVQLQIADGIVQEGWFEGEGCVVSQSAASMLMEKVERMSIDEVRNFSPQDMLELYGPTLVANRQKCCLLSWRVLQSALERPTFDEDADDAVNFGGPSLSEEC